MCADLTNTDIEELALGEPEAVVEDVIIETVPAPVTSAVAVTTAAYRYDDLPADVARAAKNAATRISEKIALTRNSMLDIGNELLAIKDKLPHGEFGKWITAEFGMTDRTAQNYMRAAEEFGDKSEIVSVLPPTVIYKLAAPSTPVAVRKKIVAEVAKGNVPPVSEINAQLAAAKEEARQKRLEAERQEMEEDRKRAEEREWQAQEKTLRDAGKTDADVEAERKRWDTAKAKKEREKVRAQQRREERHKKEMAEIEKAEERRRAAAKEAVELLRKNMGDDFDRFRQLVREAGYEFDRALGHP